MEITNRIEPKSVAAQQCPVVTDRNEMAARYRQFLGDESRLRADEVTALYFPRTVAEVVGAVDELRAAGHTCGVAAGRTGIAGGAAPIDAETLIDMSGLNRVLAVGCDGDEHYIRVEPGVSLAALSGVLQNKGFADLPGASNEEAAAGQAMMADREHHFWFPVNPTETSAHIGGTVATNASGARTYRYGPLRDWVRGVSVVLADGRLLKVRRGEVRAEQGRFLLTEKDGSEAVLAVPTIEPPSTTKATLGYPLKEDMDLIDLFIGSEGTLGVLVEIELRLAVRPQSTVGVLVVVEREAMALELVQQARARGDIRIDALEYFDGGALQLLKEKREEERGESPLVDLPNWDGCGIYFEFSGSEEQTEAACLMLEEILEQAGLSLDATWAAMEPSELAAQRLFRHAVPEAVNSIIGRRKACMPGLHKVGTDMAVPDQCLTQLFALYRRDLAQAGIESVIFGHIGDNHVHVNMLPHSMEELTRAKALYSEWAREVVAMGGAVAAEHGIGRMKKTLLTIQYDAPTIEKMREVKRVLDPEGLFSPGVLFDA